MRAKLVFAVVCVTALDWGCSFPDPNGDAVPCTSCDLPNRTKNTNGADSGTTDAAPIATHPPVDAGLPPLKKCLSTTAFGAAKLVDGIDPDRHASSPHLTADELTVYFTSFDPNDSSQIYRATRASKADPFSAVGPVPNINSASNDNDPTVSSDGLTLVFHSGRSGNNDVWWAKRTSTKGDFAAPESVPGIATADYDGQGFFHVATDELWFVSNRAGTYDIFKAKRSGGVFGTATPVNEINSAKDDFLPFLTEDGLTIYFSSTRDGTLGGQDLFLATRTNAQAAFGTPTPITELNTAVGEQAGSISPDMCRIYFSRVGGAGGQQIFVAERPLPP